MEGGETRDGSGGRDIVNEGDKKKKSCMCTCSIKI